MQFKLKKEHAIMHEQVVVDLFLMLRRDWFEAKTNGFYGKKDKFREFLLRYVSDKNTPDNNDTDLIYCSGKFDDYMEWFEPVRSDIVKDES